MSYALFNLSEYTTEDLEQIRDAQDILANFGLEDGEFREAVVIELANRK